MGKNEENLQQKRRDRLRKSLKNRNDEEITIYNDLNLVHYLLELMEYDLSHFDTKKKYGYLLNSIVYLYKSENLYENLQKEIFKKIQVIRALIQNILNEEAINILKEQSLENYYILKKLIGKIDILSLSLANSYDENYLENKYELLHYLVFSIKNIGVLKRILKKAPHQINILDEKGFLFIEEVIKTYFETLEHHVKEEPLEKLDDLLYFDRILNILLEHNITNLNVTNVTLLDKMFALKEEKTLANTFLKERYTYFIAKWRSIFMQYLSNASSKVIFSSTISREDARYQYLVNSDFSLASTYQAQTIIYQSKFDGLKSYTPKVYTVDGKGAEELDDGFSCTMQNGIYRLGVHITNPMLYLPEDSIIFKEASRRVSSVYLQDAMIPMYPLSLATGLFSLNEGNIRKVTSLYTTIDLKNEKILNFEPVFEDVYVAMNDTYHSCSYTLDMEVGQEDYVKTLVLIKDLLAFLRKFYSVDDIYRKVNRSEFNVSSTNIIGQLNSHKLIETLMIFTNHMYAKYAEEHNIPCLFRNHEMTPFYKRDLENYRKMISAEKNSSIYLNETSILESNYPRSFYSVENIGHFGLGTTAYTHFTSPDRRVPDCYNALMLQKYFLDFPDLSAEQEKERLSNLARYINQRNNSLRSFVKEYSLCRK